MLKYLQTNPAMPEYIYIGEKIKYDPVVMPAPYEIYAIVSAEEGLEKYRHGRPGFYRIVAEEAINLLEERGYNAAVCKRGVRIVLDHMERDPDPVETGSTGTIKGLDDADNVLVDWENGRTLNLILFVDQWHVER